MTKTRTNGEINRNGLFLFNKFDGVPTFHSDTPVEDRIDVLEQDFKSRLTFDVSSLLPRFIHPPYPENLDYSLRIENEKSKRRDHVPFSGEYAFKIAFRNREDRPIHVVSFDIHRNGNLRIRQNQGVQGTGPAHAGIDIPTMCYELVWSWASQFNFPRVQVPKAEYEWWCVANSWNRDGTSKIKKELDWKSNTNRFKRLWEKQEQIYDIIPVELGFDSTPKTLSSKPTDPRILEGHSLYYRT